MTTAPRDRRGADGREAEGRTARTKLAEVVAVCSRCAKRQGLRPRAVRDLLKGAAKRAPRASRRKLCVVGSGCLGPCPKRAVAVATGASLAAGRVVLLDPAAGPEAALAAVLRPVPPRRPAPEFGPNADLEPPPIPSDRIPAPGLCLAAHPRDEPVSTSAERAPAAGRPGRSPTPA